MTVTIYLKKPREKQIINFALSIIDNRRTLGVGFGYTIEPLHFEKERIRKVVIKDAN